MDHPYKTHIESAAYLYRLKIIYYECNNFIG